MIAVIRVDAPLPIAHTVRGTYELTDTDIVEVTFAIMRRVSYQDWLDYRTAQGRPITHDPQRAHLYYYYEVMTE